MHSRPPEVPITINQPSGALQGCLVFSNDCVRARRTSKPKEHLAHVYRESLIWQPTSGRYALHGCCRESLTNCSTAGRKATTIGLPHWPPTSWDARSISSQQAAPLRREPRKTRPHDVRHGTDLARRGHRTEEGEAPCQRWREARGLGRKGLPVDSNLCRRSRERQVEQCPSFENCESVRTSQSR